MKQRFVRASFLLHKNISNYVCSHLKSLDVLFLSIVMHFYIFPTVSQIAFVGIKTYQTPFIYQSIAFWLFVVVFVNLRKTI